MNIEEIADEFEPHLDERPADLPGAQARGLTDERNLEQFAALVRHQLEMLGEDSARDGLAKTPMRVAKAFEFLTRGYWQCPKKVLNDALFDVQSDEMVIVKDIDFYSLCEHHLLPFFGKCHIAYLPLHKVVGLSKLPRLVEEGQQVVLAETVEIDVFDD